jgi:hypothetical protein
MNEAINESATSGLDYKLLSIGCGRGSFFFWGLVLFAVGVFNMIFALI